jgi:hypothetical protein
MIVSVSDSLLLAATMEEYPNVLHVDLYLYNGSRQELVLEPSIFAVVDNQHTLFRRLEPHEAANLLIAQVTSMPPYQPKYNYSVSSSTYGHVDGYGNYYGNTEGTVEAEEDPWNKLGWALGSMIAENANEKLIEKAGYFYSTGMIPKTSIPAQTGLRAGLFWLNRVHGYPVYLRVNGVDFELEFHQPAPIRNAKASTSPTRPY